MFPTKGLFVAKMAADMDREELQEYKRQVKQKKQESSLLKVHVPKTSFETKHKVVLFGRIFHGKNAEEAQLYQFTHQRADNVVTDGYIPVGFLSSLTLENVTIFLAVRKGYIGPEFQVSMRTMEEVVADWDLNPDSMWSSVLSYFDKKCVFPETCMDYLDADPFVLFGIDDPVTQKALRKLERQAILLSRGRRPDIMEWTDYISASSKDPEDHHHHHHDDDDHHKKHRHKHGSKEQRKWIVQAFAETELPTPWTSYKGVGSIVCFLNHETNACTWKHPFYEYFAQLWSFCATADPVDVMLIRVNRLIWNYEASQSKGSEQMPLVSPEYVELLAEIMGFDVSKDACIVRSLKAALKQFSRSYRMNDALNKEQVLELLERLREDQNRNEITLKSWHETLNNKPFNLEDLSQGNVTCIECSGTAQSFCLECKDYYCNICFNKFHGKGHRAEHVPFRLISCSLCTIMPAKVHCTFTDKSLCHECYAMKHIMTLPKDARETAPKKINYAKQQNAVVKHHQMQNELQMERPKSGESRLSKDSYGSVLTFDWHAFYDSKGIKFYYNLRTGERMRRSPTATPRTSPDQSEAGFDRHSMAGSIDEDYGDNQLEGPRAIRAPFRSHPEACEFKDVNKEEWADGLKMM